MKTKKYKHADLEGKRGVFFQLGLIVALGVSLAAFEWGSTSKGLKKAVYMEDYTEVDVMIPVTHPKEKKPELPKALKLIDVFKQVENNYEGPDDDPVFVSDPEDGWNDVPTMGEEDEVPSTFFRVEKMPVFPGGSAALLKYIARSVKYPVICVETGVAGKVFVSFVVNEYGQVVDAKIARSPDSNLSREALRVVNTMPKWTPGYQRDKAVRVAYTIPVNFVLQ